MRAGLEKYSEKIFRFMLFISSYLPLFLILFLKNIEHMGISIILGVFFVILPLLTIRIYIQKPLRHEPNTPIVIDSINNKDADNLSYISGYIIPFIAFNSDVVTTNGISIKELLIVVILVAVICNLYMRANMYYINPVIGLFYDVYTSPINNEQVIILVQKGMKIKVRERIVTRRLSRNAYLILERDIRKNEVSIIKIILICIFLMSCLWIWNPLLRSTVKEYSEIGITFIREAVHRITLMMQK